MSQSKQEHPKERQATQETGRKDFQSLIKDWGQEVDHELLVLAMTHRSFAHEQGKTGSAGTNERLEFLGDAVLQIIVTEYLFRLYPSEPEGNLAQMRAATVSQTPLAEVARKLNLGNYLMLGVGEDRQGGRDKDSILSDTVEALIGASFLSGGLETTRITVERHLRKILRQAPQRAIGLDWRTALTELVQSHNLGEIAYTLEASGPDHAKVFTATVFVGGKELSRGSASSKKSAEHAAAELAVSKLKKHFGAADA